MSSTMAGCVSGGSGAARCTTNLSYGGSLVGRGVCLKEDLGAAPCKTNLHYDRFRGVGETGTGDCAVDTSLTLSLGRGCRRTIHSSTVLSRSGPPLIDKCAPQGRAQYQVMALDSAANFAREVATECSRDSSPQSYLSSRRSPMGSSAPAVADGSRFRCPTSEFAPRSVSSTTAREFLPSHPIYFSAIDHPEVFMHPSEYSRRAQSFRRVVSRVERPAVSIPEFVAHDGDVPSSFPSPGLDSSSNRQSPRDGESRFAHRAINVEVTGSANIARSSSLGRTCASCGIGKTPLWRNGPQGPKSLCNACGIRFTKAEKRNSSNGSCDLPVSNLVSASRPYSVAAKSSKRKSGSSISITRPSWTGETGREAAGSDLSNNPKISKKGKMLGRIDSLASSGSEDENAASSANSCVSWQYGSNSPTCITPTLFASSSTLSAAPDSSLARIASSNHSAMTGAVETEVTGVAERRFSQDEREGAILLMGLSATTVLA